jgi:integrase
MIEHAIEAKRRSKGKLGGTVTAHTVEICRTKLGHFARVFGDEFPLSLIDYDAVGRFITQRETEPGAAKGSKCSQHEISKELQQLRFALRLEQARGNYQHDVDHVTRMGKFAVGYTPRERHLTWEDIPAVIESVAWGNAGKVTQATLDRARALRIAGSNVRQIAKEMGVAYATAHRYMRMSVAEPTPLAVLRSQHVAWIIACCARRSESYMTEMKDHDLVNWRVRIRGSKTAGSAAVITIAPRFREWLLFALYGRPTTGKLYPPWANVYRSLRLACRRIGIEKISPNDLRRTHSSLLSQAGVPHSVLKNVTRHTTTVMLDRVYGQQTIESTARVIELTDTDWPALPGSTITTQTKENVRESAEKST